MLEQAGIKAHGKKHTPPSERPRTKLPGMGETAPRRIGARAGQIPHGSLKSGDPCPDSALKGKVYVQNDPVWWCGSGGRRPSRPRSTNWKVPVQPVREMFDGSAGERGREEVRRDGGGMIAMLSYGSGVPFYRLEGLEASLGIPCRPRHSGRSSRKSPPDPARFATN